MSDDYDLKQCAHCGAYVPQEAGMCAQCGTSDVDGVRSGGPTAPRGKPFKMPAGWTVTRVIVWLNIAYFVFSLYVQHQLFPDRNVIQSILSFGGMGSAVAYSGGYIHERVVGEGEYWRIVTAGFLHHGGIHIAVNMWSLRNIGTVLEEAIGPVRFAALYMVSLVCSSAAISIWHYQIMGGAEPMNVAGASGAIFGVFGALGLMALRAPDARARAMGRRIMRDIALWLLLGWVIEVFSNTGHIGGLLAGGALAFMMQGVAADRMRGGTPAIWRVVASAGALVAALGLVVGAYQAIQFLQG